MKKRIFAAIEISEEAKRKADELIMFLHSRFPHARVGWTRPEKLHLTLKFFGETDEEKIADIVSAGEATASSFETFKIQIAETGVFPSARKARVLWLGVADANGKLFELNRIFENECASRGFESEKRIFKAHLTLARLKENTDELSETHLAQKFAPIETKVAEIVIFQSELRPTGAVYTVISRHRLRVAEN